MKRSLLVAAACSLVLAACSGDDSSSAADTTTAGTVGPLLPPETVRSSDVLQSPSSVAVPDTPLCNAAAEVLAIGNSVEPQVDAAVRQGLATQSMQPVVDTVQSLTSDGTIEKLLAAYDEMTDVVPLDQAENVQTVRSYTKAFLDDIAAMPNAEELQAYVTGAIASQDGQAATAATAALDEVVVAECRFSLTG